MKVSTLIIGLIFILGCQLESVYNPYDPLGNAKRFLDEEGITDPETRKAFTDLILMSWTPPPPIQYHPIVFEESHHCPQPASNYDLPFSPLETPKSIFRHFLTQDGKEITLTEF